MNTYTTTDWVWEQTEDMILGRVCALCALLHSNKVNPRKCSLLKEAPNVRHIYMQGLGGAGLLSGHFLPHNRPWQIELFCQVHKKECQHYMGYDRVYAMLQRLYRYNMSQDVLVWLKVCKTYQQTKLGCGHGKAPLTQEYINAPMVQVGMGIAGPKPKREQVHPGNTGLKVKVKSAGL